MNELKLDRMVANNLIAFPGTKLFEQVKKEGLFIKEIDFDNLWKTPITHAQSEFIIKPYKMSIEQLDEWRLKFDEIRYKYLGSGGYTQRTESHIKGKQRLSYGSFPIRDGYLPSSRVGISQPTPG